MKLIYNEISEIFIKKLKISFKNKYKKKNFIFIK